MDVFILGYPFGSKLPAFPVWKRGSIASEPELLGLDGTHYYLVDTASRPGMSGSPVILRSWKHHILETGRPATTQFDDVPIDRFIGVYSGRLATQPNEAQVGMVWDGSLIEQIIAGDQRDTFPES